MATTSASMSDSKALSLSEVAWTGATTELEGVWLLMENSHTLVSSRGKLITV